MTITRVIYVLVENNYLGGCDEVLELRCRVQGLVEGRDYRLLVTNGGRERGEYLRMFVSSMLAEILDDMSQYDCSSL